MSRMQTANFDRMLGSAIADIGMKCNYRHHLDGSEKKAIIVEGYTDEAFMNRIQKSDVLCYSIRRFLEARAKMLKCDSSKGIIFSLFQRLSNNPEFFGFPKGCGKWHIYGLVDRDYDDETLNLRMPRLFITDTHDIETLILSTDHAVLSRIQGVTIDTEKVKSSLFISFQLACYRKALYNLPDRNLEIDTRKICSPDGTINYAAFVENDAVVPGKLIELLFSNKDTKISREKLNRFTKGVMNDRHIKKYCDRNGEWKIKKETFSPDQIDDFWLLVCGHDILSAICFYDAAANDMFRDTGGYKVNRQFEKAIIDYYDVAMFRKTDLYRSLKEADLVG